MTSRSFSWSSILKLGNVPGTPDEVRAFLQRRVLLFIGGAFVLWTGTLVVDFLVKLLFGARLFELAMRQTFWLHVVGAGMLIALFLLLRRGTRSLAVLNGVDAASTVLQGVVMAWFASSIPARYLPEMVILLGMTEILVVRAVVIPSSPSRTAVLGAISLLPTIASAWSSAPDPVAEGNVFAAIRAGIWSIVTVGVTAFISRIVFGLHDEVRRAKRLGQYTLLEQIGRGGMGVVHLAQHALLRRPTAIKLLPRERAGALALARFEREVQLTSQLTHPNTVAVYDYGHTPDGVFYYAMEYLEGMNLEELVRVTGPLPEGRVLHVLRQAAGSLMEAHQRGLIHRDVKPSNLILGQRGPLADFLKVVDFGLVRDQRSEDPGVTGTSVIAGSPLYMSPEQIVDPAGVDPRSDIYALGAVAYFLLTGTPPFPAGTLVEICAAHLHQEPESPSSRLGRQLAPSVEALVLACLRKDPAARPASARELSELLDACDGFDPWTPQHAQAWWLERGGGLHDRTRTLGANGTAAGATLDVAPR